MAGTKSIERLTDAEANHFRKVMRHVMALKGLSFKDVTEELSTLRDGDLGDEWVRNRIREGSRPLLASDAKDIWNVVSRAKSRISHRRDGAFGMSFGDQVLTKAKIPQRDWWVREALCKISPGANIPDCEISAFAAMIATRVASTRAKQNSIARAIEKLLVDRSEAMRARWETLAKLFVMSENLTPTGGPILDPQFAAMKAVELLSNGIKGSGRRSKSKNTK